MWRRRERCRKHAYAPDRNTCANADAPDRNTCACADTHAYSDSDADADADPNADPSPRSDHWREYEFARTACIGDVR
jgi:hypothetical protein